MQALFVAVQQIRAFFLNQRLQAVFHRRVIDRKWGLSDKSTSHTPISGATAARVTIAGKMVRMQQNVPLKPHAEPRSAYRVLRTIPTRWSDNDVYGHVNNVVYYSWFDTAVNAYLMEQGVLDIHAGGTIGLVVETQCNYFASVSFPEVVQAGIRVAKLGTSSVRYEIGIFGEGETTAAKGHFIHVYVDRLTRKPVPLPDALRQLLETLQ
jgi:acyl-CoA thioester hydrolase